MENPDQQQHETVEVSLNGKERRIKAGTYTTAQLKAALHVDPALDLDIVENGVFRTLTEADNTTVKEHMICVSHVHQ